MGTEKWAQKAFSLCKLLQVLQCVIRLFTKPKYRRLPPTETFLLNLFVNFSDFGPQKLQAVIFPCSVHKTSWRTENRETDECLASPHTWLTGTGNTGDPFSGHPIRQIALWCQSSAATQPDGFFYSPELESVSQIVFPVEILSAFVSGNAIRPCYPLRVLSLWYWDLFLSLRTVQRTFALANKGAPVLDHYWPDTLWLRGQPTWERRRWWMMLTFLFCMYII